MKNWFLSADGRCSSTVEVINYFYKRLNVVLHHGLVNYFRTQGVVERIGGGAGAGDGTTRLS